MSFAYPAFSKHDLCNGKPSVGRLSPTITAALKALNERRQRSDGTTSAWLEGLRFCCASAKILSIAVRRAAKTFLLAAIASELLQHSSINGNNSPRVHSVGRGLFRLLSSTPLYTLQ